MLNTASPISRSMLGSALAGQSMIKPKGGRLHRATVAGLLLTSLVDAFSILVIFLIMNTGASQDVVNLGEKITLPQAGESQLINDGIVVRVENGRFMVDEKEVALSALISELKTLNESADEAKKDGLVIVADRSMDYADLSPVILAGSQAGFTKFKFAVLRKE